jgi:hypothetical protein
MNVENTSTSEIVCRAPRVQIDPARRVGRAYPRCQCCWIGERTDAVVLIKYLNNRKGARAINSTSTKQSRYQATHIPRKDTRVVVLPLNHRMEIGFKQFNRSISVGNFELLRHICIIKQIKQRRGATSNYSQPPFI